jgi:hypothetical protein
MSSSDSQKLVAAALRRLDILRRREAFDPSNLESKPTAKQQEVFDDFSNIKQQWIRAGNQSGKSQTCARIVTWVLTDTHPVWGRPETWGEEPLLIIVAGRTGKQIEDSLLPKIRSFLEPGTYKEVRIGNIIQRLELTNGNRVVFQSLENPNIARERLMSYVAHLVWIDELPPTIELVRELLVRVQARNGYFLASFTPTVVSAEIQRYVDSLSEPEGKVYRFHMLDNPLYGDAQRKAELLARYSQLPDHVQKAIFEGEWMSSDDQVYYFHYAQMVRMPDNYSPLWRHVEAVDPALKSALGLTVWAEDPASGQWYCIHAEKVRGIYVPTELVQAIREKTSRYNIVRRISDPHEVWYIQTAASMGLSYIGVHRKSERKAELIKQLQEKMGKQVFVAPHCEQLIEEFQECRWSNQAEGKIVNASSYHLLDSAQYFCDNIPKAEKRIQASSWQDWLWKANEERKQSVEKARSKSEKRRIRIQRKRHVS